MRRGSRCQLLDAAGRKACASGPKKIQGTEPKGLLDEQPNVLRYADSWISAWAVSARIL